MWELIFIEHEWQCFSFQHFKTHAKGVSERIFPELTGDEKLNNRDLQAQCNFRNVKTADKISSFIIYPIKTTNIIGLAEKDLNKIKLEQLHEKNTWVGESSRVNGNNNVQPLSWTSFH